MNRQIVQNKEGIKALLESCIYKEAFDILLDKYVRNFLEKEFTLEINHPSYDYLKANLRGEILDKATSHMAETIEMVYGRKRK